MEKENDQWLDPISRWTDRKLGIFYVPAGKNKGPLTRTLVSKKPLLVSKQNYLLGTSQRIMSQAATLTAAIGWHKLVLEAYRWYKSTDEHGKIFDKWELVARLTLDLANDKSTSEGMRFINSRITLFAWLNDLYSVVYSKKRDISSTFIQEKRRLDSADSPTGVDLAGATEIKDTNGKVIGMAVRVPKEDSTK